MSILPNADLIVFGSGCLLVRSSGVHLLHSLGFERKLMWVRTLVLQLQGCVELLLLSLCFVLFWLTMTNVKLIFQGVSRLFGDFDDHYYYTVVARTV